MHGEIDAQAEEHDDKDERQGVEAAHRERGPAERQQHARGEQGEDRGDRAPGSNAESQDGGEHEQRQRTGELYARKRGADLLVCEFRLAREPDANVSGWWMCRAHATQQLDVGRVRQAFIEALPAPHNEHFVVLTVEIGFKRRRDLERDPIERDPI